jgi:protein-S-isoprenylcysteine O-methyltransferase Ste14
MRQDARRETSSAGGHRRAIAKLPRAPPAHTMNGRSAAKDGSSCGPGQAARSSAAHAASDSRGGRASRRAAAWGSGLAEAVRQFARHWPTLVAGVAVLAADSPWIAIAWFAASRGAYVLFVALSLRAEERRASVDGRDAAWRRFSARASWLMDNDGVAFAGLCLATGGYFPIDASWAVSIAAGAVLAAVGVGVKAWAAASLSAGSYHWRNFFVPPAPRTLTAAGPYRWLSNPMYTLGYAHAYGLAIAVQSSAGLIAAAAAQASILLLYVLVERPHLVRLREGISAAGRAGEGV